MSVVGTGGENLAKAAEGVGAGAKQQTRGAKAAASVEQTGDLNAMLSDAVSLGDADMEEEGGDEGDDGQEGQIEGESEDDPNALLPPLEDEEQPDDQLEEGAEDPLTDVGQEPAAPKAPAKTDMQLFMEAQQQTNQTMQSFMQNLPQLMAAQTQQFVANLQRSSQEQIQQQQVQQQFEASRPRDPGPEAPYEEQQQFRLDQLKWDGAQREAKLSNQIQSLEKRLGAQEKGVRMERAHGEIENALGQVMADPNYGWWMKDSEISDEILSATNAAVAAGKKFSPQLVAEVSHKFLRMFERYAHHRGPALQSLANRTKKPAVAAKPGQKPRPGGPTVQPLRGGGGGGSAPGSGGAKPGAKIDKEMERWGLLPGSKQASRIR